MDYDVIVIGGGPAGLAAATALARSRRDVLVVDAGEPRNATSPGAHNVLGHDGIAPQDLLAKGRAEVASYGAQVRPGRVRAAQPVDSGFEVTLDDGAVLTARRLVLTAGVVDVLPDVPGLRQHWGRDVVHCPYCHGWEVRDTRIGVLLTSPMGLHQALLFSQLSDDLVILANGIELDEAARAQLDALGAEVVEGEVTKVLGGERVSGVALADGREIALQTLVIGPRVEVPEPFRTDVVEALGLEAEEHVSTMGTFVAADPMTGATAAPGVYAAGSITEPPVQITASMAAGTRAGAMANMDLIQVDLQERMNA